jgi:uncharacterized protein (DUF4415 family)
MKRDKTTDAYDDNPEWTKEDFDRARPAHEVLPRLIGKKNAEILLKRGRPKKPAAKKQITVRLDPDVIAFFKKQGDGYHSRINQALRDWMDSR